MAQLHDYSLVKMSECSYYLRTYAYDWTMQALNRDMNSEYIWLAVLCIASNVKHVSEGEHWRTNHQLVQHALRLGQHQFQNTLDNEDLDESQCNELYSRSLGITLTLVDTDSDVLNRSQCRDLFKPMAS